MHCFRADSCNYHIFFVDGELGMEIIGWKGGWKYRLLLYELYE